MKILSVLLIMVFFASCASEHDKLTHHHHTDSSGIAPGDHGEGKYKVDHFGEVFYFDTEEDFNKFVQRIDSEKKQAHCIRKARGLVCKKPKL